MGDVDKKIGDVFTTKEYAKFKHLVGNRCVEKRRINRIRESINAVGYVMNPIVVNERMEVIDGQARLIVLEELDLPICYVISPGAGIEQCRQLNIGQSNWRTIDYVESYADGGNENYVRLLNLVSKYAKTFKSIDAVFGVVMNTILCGGSSAKHMKSGSLNLPEEDMEDITAALDFAVAHLDGISRIDGDTRAKISAICWVYRNTNADKKRLGKIFDERDAEFQPVAAVKIERFLRDLSNIYNWHMAPDKCIYLAEEYDRFIRRK